MYYVFSKRLARAVTCKKKKMVKNLFLVSEKKLCHFSSRNLWKYILEFGGSTLATQTDDIFRLFFDLPSHNIFSNSSALSKYYYAHVKLTKFNCLKYLILTQRRAM